MNLARQAGIRLGMQADQLSGLLGADSMPGLTENRIRHQAAVMPIRRWIVQMASSIPTFVIASCQARTG